VKRQMFEELLGSVREAGAARPTKALASD